MVLGRNRIAMALAILALIVASTVLLLRQPTEAGSKGSPLAGLRCKQGELLGSTHNTFNRLVPGLATPEAVLQENFAAEWPGLTVQKLLKVSDSPGSTQFDFPGSDGQPMASFNLVNWGNGWHLEGWSACQTFVHTFFKPGQS